jgi:hypothetical protein
VGRIRLLVAMVVVVGTISGWPLGLVGAQPATPAAVEFPAASAPYGLGGVALPADEDGIEALLDGMPPEVAGEDRTLMGRRPVWDLGGSLCVLYGVDEHRGYSANMTLCADNLDLAPSALGRTAGEVVSAKAHGLTDPPGFPAEPAVEASGRDGTLAWVLRTTMVGGEVEGGPWKGTPLPLRPRYHLGWGSVDSPWLFTASAWTPEEREAVVRAFVAAAGATAATPSP